MRAWAMAVLLFGLLLPSAWAQTLEWDPPTALENGDPVPAGEQVEYRVFAGDSEATLTERAIVNTPSVPLSDLNLQPSDAWVAVEARSSVRVGARSAAVKRMPYKIAFTLRIIQTLGP